jgi:hypothetical protein
MEPWLAILCLQVCLAGVSTCFCTLLIKRNYLVTIFSVSCVSVFVTGGLLIPTGSCDKGFVFSFWHYWEVVES